MDIRTMERRSAILSSTREFFLSRGYLETDTPILSPALIPESCLEVFATEFVHPFSEGFPLYLTPSPEVWMKRVIAETGRSVFQIAKAFRNAESIGRLHNPEFTMLEYYTVGFGSDDSIALTEELFAALISEDSPPQSRPPFRVMSMEEAFRDLAKLELRELASAESIREAARSLDLMVPEGCSWEDGFNILFLSLVEPRLPQDRPLVVDGYPEAIRCLAAPRADGPYRQRWELYVRGVEVANCYSELADPAAVAEYYAEQTEKKKAMLVPHAVDPDYPSLFRAFPPCSGVAIGFDRLVMSLIGKDAIAEVMPFPFTAFPGSPHA